MKKILAILIGLLILPSALAGQSSGDGTIRGLEQFVSTSTPQTSITQRIWGRPLKITGLTSLLPICTSSTGLATTTGCTTSSGDVVGPSSSVDNSIVRFDSTTGKLIQGYTSGAPTVTDTGRILADDGAVGSPTYAFTSAPTSGLYFTASEFRWAMAGSNFLRMSANQLYLTNTGGVANIRLGSTIIQEDAADILALRNSTNAQKLRVYGTFTTTSNYERFEIVTAAGATTFQQTQAGAGVARGIDFGTTGSAAITFFTNNSNRWQISSAGVLQPSTDNTLALGASGSRINNAFFGGKVLASVTGGATYVGYEIANGTVTGRFEIQASDDSLNVGTVSNHGLWFKTNDTRRFGPSNAGHLVFNTDNIYDVGLTASLRPRTVNAGTSVVAPVVTAATSVTGANVTLVNNELRKTDDNSFLQISGGSDTINSGRLVFSGATRTGGPRFSIEGGVLQSDIAPTDSFVTASRAYTSAATNKTGANLVLRGGLGTAAADTGGYISFHTAESGAGATHSEKMRLTAGGGFILSGTTVSSGAGAVAITGSIHEITTTGIGNALTLADGAEGQRLTIVYVAEGAGTDTAVLTPTNFGSGATITFSVIGQSARLIFTNGKWYADGAPFGAVIA